MPTRNPHRPTTTAVDPCPLVRWIGWHLGELVGVIAPAVLALTVSSWWGVVSVVITAGWVTHEIQLHRRRTAVRAITSGSHATGRDRPPGTSQPDEEASA